MGKSWILAIGSLIIVANTAAVFAADPLPIERFAILTRHQEDPDFGIPPILDRELMRQAILLAARDDMGLWTRDEVLDEAMPQATGDLDSRKIVLTVTLGDAGDKLQLKFTAGGRSEQAIVEIPSIPNTLYPDDFVPDVFNLAINAEILSRSKFASWLKSAGFGDANVKAISGDETIPKDIEARLEDLTIFSQYAAIRAAHQSIADSGPTRGMLEVLARGYANLGQITRFHWTGSSDVFTARSLLYAQRLVNSAPKLARTRWTRAYVLAMAGLHAAAIADLDAVIGADDPPVWVAMVDHLCHYDTTALQELAGTVDKQYMVLGEFMAFLTAENSHITSVVMQAGKPIMEATPHCDRVIDAMCDSAGVSYLHDLTDSRFDATVSLYRQELPRISDLPKSVQDAWTTAHTNPNLMADIASVAQAFVDSSEPTEPSWSALGKMLQESNFVHVYRRAYFMVFSWNVDCADFIHQAGVLAEGHRFEPIIKSFATYNHDDIPQKAKGIQTVDATFRFPYNAPWSLIEFQNNEWEQIWKPQRAHVNATAWDCERNSLTDWTAAYDPNKVQQHARWLRVISPFSPVAAAEIIKNHFLDEKNPLKFLEEMNKQFGGQPAFAAVVSEYYIGQTQYDKAIPILQAIIPRTQSVADYRQLANCYLMSNDEDHWLSTLTESLKLEDFALDHSFTQQLIANHFMAQMNYQRALSYAEGSAESGAEWAILCAARCHAGLGDWDQSQQLVKDAADRYGRSQGSLYMFSRVTGHGDLNSSRASYQEFVQRHPKDVNGAILSIGEGQMDQELEFLKAMVADDPKNRFDGLWLATALEQSGDHDGASAMLRKLSSATYGDTQPDYQNYLWSTSTNFLRLEGLLPNPPAPRRGGRAGQPVDVVVRTLNYIRVLAPSEQATIQFFMGEFLLGPGNRPDLGLQCMKFAALNSELNDAVGFMARLELIKRNVDPFNPDVPTTRPSTRLF